jgi:HAD superfamily hydrolase (TIGR01509 family)
LETKYGLFFDMDGTLIDSEPLKARALSETISFFGGSASPQFYQKVMGKNYEAVRAYFIKLGKVSLDLQKFDQKFHEIYKNYLENRLEFSTVTREFLKISKEQGYKLAMVSSATSWMLENISKKFEIGDLFDLKVTAENVIRHKPHPEAYQYCLNRLTIQPEHALVFEDTEFGIQAALAAGIKVIGVKHNYNVNHNFDGTIKTIKLFSDIKLTEIRKMVNRPPC